MHKDWLIIALLLGIASISFTASYEIQLFNLVLEYINRLISPITVGILP